MSLSYFLLSYLLTYLLYLGRIHMGVSYLIIMVPWKMQLSESHVSNSENFLSNLKLRRHQEWKVSDVVLIPINVEKTNF